MQLGLTSEIFNAILYNVKNLISVYKMYVTLKFDDNGCCRIHSVSYGEKRNSYQWKICGYALEDG